MSKKLSIKRWAVTYVEYGDSVDGKARILDLFSSPQKAQKKMIEAANSCKKFLHLDGEVAVFNDSASVGDTEECGCVFKIEAVTIPLLPTDHDVWVH